MEFNMIRSYNLGGVTLRSGDKAYNKNKREQVENPHKVIGFVNKNLIWYVILETPSIAEYIIEPCDEVEKYIEDPILESSKGPRSKTVSINLGFNDSNDIKISFRDEG